MQVKQPTVNGIFVTRGTFNNRDIAYLYRPKGGRWVQVFWAQAVAVAREIGLGLEKEDGVKKGDRVAILSSVRPEWSAADHGILSIGAVTVGLYESLAPEQVAYVLRHSGARVLLVEDQAQLDKVAAVWDALKGQVQRIYAFDPVADPRGLPVGDIDKMRKRGDKVHLRDQDYWQATALAVAPDDLASLVYTSGTTGDPKGVMITHGNLWYVVDTVSKLLPMGSEARSVCYLPLAHILQRYALYTAEWQGINGYFAGDVQNLPQHLRDVHPTLLLAVPRVLEKMYDRIQDAVDTQPEARQQLFRLALRAGVQRSQRLQQRRFVPPHLQLQWKLADRFVFSKVKERLGGQLQTVMCGSAPLSPSLCEFFHALGILVLEGYGLSETSAPITLNTPEAFRFGTVGKPLPGTDIRVAADGEVEVKGPGVFRGYWQDEAATRAAFTPDGFFRTGDIGEFDGDGFLKLTGRKKELIITSGGKNVAPSFVEGLLDRSRRVAQSMVVGEGRPYLCALVVPEPEALRAFAAEKGLRGDAGAWIGADEVREWIAHEIRDANSRLSRPEMVRRFELVPNEWTVDAGELTPTLKLRRAVVFERHRALIEAMYAGGGTEVG